jgi:nucleotide-binding universal stress UspA family protein
MTATAENSASGPVVVCYDDSEKALEAIDYVAALLPGTRAIVVTVWEPIIEEVLTGPGPAPPIADPLEANERARSAASAVASEGARRASQAGLRAEPLVAEAEDGLWKAVEQAARGRGAGLIACGTDRSGVRYALPGSLANALVQHAGRPVLVVPSAKATAERRRQLERE